MSLANDYRKAAIERRQRMNAAGLQLRAKELEVRRAPRLVIVSPPNLPANQVPDELRRATVNKYPTISEIRELVMEYFRVTEVDLFSRRRMKKIITPRHTLFWLCRKATPHSLPQIGRLLGGYDHTTIIHGLNSIEQRILTEEAVAHDCAYLLGELTGVRPKPYWGC